MESVDAFIERTLELLPLSILTETDTECMDEVVSNSKEKSRFESYVEVDDHTNAIIFLLNEVPKTWSSTSDLDKLYILDPRLHTRSLLALLVSYLEFLKLNNIGIQEKWPGLVPVLYWFARNFNPSSITHDLPSFLQLATHIEKLFEPSVLKNSTGNLLKFLQITRICQLLVSRAELGNLLTPLHSIALKFAILAKAYRFAYPLTQLDPTTLKFSKNLSRQEFILYYYYSALIQINLGKFEEAFENLELIIVGPERGQTTNSNSLSFTQVEAARKYLLLGLILFGKVPELPVLLKHALKDELNMQLKSYNTLGSFFSSGNLKKFRESLTQHDYFKDGNLGLVKKCEDVFIKQAILRLPNYYNRVGLKDIHEILVNVSSTRIQEQLFDLISQGHLQAEIVNYQGPGNGMVILEAQNSQLNPTHPGDEILLFEQLLSSMKEIDALTDTSQNIGHSIILSHSNTIQTAKTQRATRSLSRPQNSRGPWY